MELVPLDMLPDDNRPKLKADSPEFKAYAAQLEKSRQLAPGTLTAAKFEGSDPTALLLAAATDAGRQAPRATIPNNFPPRAPERPIDPSEGGLPLNFGPIDTGVTMPQGLSRLMAGAGKSGYDTARGLGQAGGFVPQADVDEAAKRDAPLMRTGMGNVGYAGGVTAQSALPFGALSKAVTNPYAAAGLSGALYSATQPVESGSSRSGQTVVGGLASMLGQGVGEGMKAMVRPAWQTLEPAVADLAKRAVEKFKIPFRAGDMSPNPVLRTLQSASDIIPGSGGKASAENVQKQYNLALAQTMGESNPHINQALHSAKVRLGQNYDDLAARNTAELTQADGQHLLQAWRDFRRTDTSLNKDMSKNLDDYMGNLVANGNATFNSTKGVFEMPGAVYKKFRSEAGKLAQQATAKGEGTLADFYGQVKQTLDKSMRQSSTITPEDQALYRLTDKQYGNMKTLSNATPKDASGDVDFKRLADVMMGKQQNNIYNRNAMIYGAPASNDLVDLAKIGVQFGGRGVPPTKLDSYKRLGINAARAGVLPAAAGGLYAMNMHDDDPIGDTFKEGAGIIGLGLLGSRALGSQWFARGASPFTKKAVDKLADYGLAARGTGLGSLLSAERGSAPHLGAPRAASAPSGIVPYDLLPEEGR